jgi:hypothetical protein
MLAEFETAIDRQANGPAAHPNNPLPLAQAIQQRASQRTTQMLLALGPIPAQPRYGVASTKLRRTIACDFREPFAPQVG